VVLKHGLLFGFHGNDMLRHNQRSVSSMETGETWLPWKWSV